ncbi:MAG: TetR/AcrR family transcriptional regulator [Pseudomonadota bacterium]
MGRPSLKKERAFEILEAFMRCVARYGLDGSTQDRIAEEAGVNRTLLRHYVGNRDEMVAALLDHIESRFDEMTLALVQDLPPQERSRRLLDRLFAAETHATIDAAVYQALVAASDRYPGIRDRLTDFLDRFEATLAQEFAREHPSAESETCSMVATGIAAIYFSFDSSLPLKPPPSWRLRHRAAADALLERLRD